MLLLLALCIVVPGGIYGYLSVRQVEERFRQETVRRMRLQSREIGMAAYNGLSSTETQVVFLADILAGGALPAVRVSPDRGALFHSPLLLGATRFRQGSRAELLFGKPCPRPTLDDAGRRHLVAGDSLLYLRRDAPDGMRLFLAHAVPRGSPARDLLVCEVNPDYLWGKVRDAIPPASEVAVLLGDGTMLFQTHPLPPAVLERIARDRTGGPAGYFEWGKGDRALLVDHFAVFLKPSFRSEDWVVVVSQPRSEAFAAGTRLSRALFLSIALVALVAGLFAHVQLRRNVAPLGVLEDATRRIRNGDFHSRVEIESGDEFEELGRSFNAMAERLGRAFRMQAEMGKAVQAILGETDSERIVDALLTRIHPVVPCDCAGLVLAGRPGRDPAAVLHLRDTATAVALADGVAVPFLTAEEAVSLQSLETGAVAGPEGDFGEILSRWPVAGFASFRLSPLVSRADLLGVLLLGYRDPPQTSRESLILLRQVADQAAISLSRSRLLDELTENNLGTLEALASAVDTNSPWTAGHSQRVTALSMELGRELGLPPQDIDLLHRGGLLHDIGKLGVPPSILDKAGKLTEEEFAVVKGHPSAGARILEPIPSLQKVIPMVSQHHERINGGGYPLGLAGNAISLYARIVMVADVVDALASDRPYRRGWCREEIHLHMRKLRGTQFDPDVVDAFLRVATKEDAAAADDLARPLGGRVSEGVAPATFP